MDKGVGGCVGPIFIDGSFEYIPIPDLFTTEKCTYSTCMGRKGEYLSKYVPKKLYDIQMHYDPDFRGVPVYGDGTSHRDIFLDLIEDDLMFFYAGLSPWRNDRIENGVDLYIIGYIIVERSIKINLEKIFEIPENAHSKRYEYIKKLARYVEEVTNYDYSDLVNHYYFKLSEEEKFDEDIIVKGMKSISNVQGSNIGHSNIYKLNKSIEKILDVPTWKVFLKASDAQTVLETYAYLIDKFSRFTLVIGKPTSRLLTNAIKISQKSKNRIGRLENVVTNEWARILGIPKGLSLQRKNPRWIPNPRYYFGNIDELKDKLITNYT